MVIILQKVYTFVIESAFKVLKCRQLTRKIICGANVPVSKSDFKDIYKLRD